MREGSDPSTTTTTVKTGRELSSVAYQGSDAVFEMMDSVEFARMTLSDRWWTEGAGRGRREPAGRRVPRLPDGAPRTGSDPDRDGDVQNDRGVGRVASHWRRPGPHQGHRVCGRSVGAEQSAGLPARLRPDATVPIDSGAERHARRFPGCWRVGRRSPLGSVLLFGLAAVLQHAAGPLEPVDSRRLVFPPRCSVRAGELPVDGLADPNPGTAS
jgi:hypothetical protein